MTQKGSSLLEVLIAMLILSLGLISLLSLQITSLRRTNSAYWETLASVQVYSLLEILRANSSDAVRQNEYQLWNQQNLRLLPNGIGSYQCASEICTSSVSWQEQNTQTVILSSRL
jgi:type IV pilus modification protein PilV